MPGQPISGATRASFLRSHFQACRTACIVVFLRQA